MLIAVSYYNCDTFKKTDNTTMLAIEEYPELMYLKLNAI